jgi:hypothetical protein
VKVFIRFDLAEAGPDAAETFFIDDNYTRQQLTPLRKARCLQRKLESRERTQVSRFDGQQRERLKTDIGKEMGLTLRTVNRYLLLLTAPQLIQDAFDRGELSMVVAGKVAGMSRTRQAEIVRRIEAGEETKKVVKEHLDRPEPVSGNVPAAFTKVVVALNRHTPILRGHADQIVRWQLTVALPSLQAAQVLLNELIAQVQREAS